MADLSNWVSEAAVELPDYLVAAILAISLSPSIPSWTAMASRPLDQAKLAAIHVPGRLSSDDRVNMMLIALEAIE